MDILDMFISTTIRIFFPFYLQLFVLSFLCVNKSICFLWLHFETAELEFNCNV